MGEHGVQTSLVHVASSAITCLLVGRDNKLFAPLETALLVRPGRRRRGAVHRRTLDRPHHAPRLDVPRAQHSPYRLGHHPRRSQASLADRLSDDELSTLSRTINGMLDQIEQLVHGVRNVSNSIAHDLRTPLAELRSRLEELALIRPSPETTFAEIDGAVADVDRVIRIFDALLRLAEIDAGMRRSGFVSVDLADLAGDRGGVLCACGRAQENPTCACTPTATLRVSGDPGASGAGAQQSHRQRAQIRPGKRHDRRHLAAAAGRTAEIAVTDNGPGIERVGKIQGRRSAFIAAMRAAARPASGSA